LHIKMVTPIHRGTQKCLALRAVLANQLGTWAQSRSALSENHLQTS
jgi:hypothetical protein